MLVTEVIAKPQYARGFAPERLPGRRVRNRTSTRARPLAAEPGDACRLEMHRPATAANGSVRTREPVSSVTSKVQALQSEIAASRVCRIRSCAVASTCARRSPAFGRQSPSSSRAKPSVPSRYLRCRKKRGITGPPPSAAHTRPQAAHRHCRPTPPASPGPGP